MQTIVLENAEQLTATWLKPFIGTNIEEEVAVIPATSSPHLCQVFRVNVKRIENNSNVEQEEEEQDNSFIFKIHPASHAHQQFAKMMRFMEREQCFFQSVLPLGMEIMRMFKIPQALAVAGSEDGTKMNILFEDMTPHGYKAGDLVKGCSATEARSIVKALASLHATFWVPHESSPNVQAPEGDGRLIALHELYGNKQQDKPILRLNNPIYKTTFLDSLEKLLPVFLNLKQAQIPKDIVEGLLNASKLIPKVTELVQDASNASTAFGQTVYHGDFKLENLLLKETPPMFEEDDEPTIQVAILDWQTFCVGNETTCAMDLNHFVSANLSIKQQQEIMVELLETYVSTFVACSTLATGVEPPITMESFKKQFSRAVLWELVLLIFGIAKFAPALAKENLTEVEKIALERQNSYFERILAMVTAFKQELLQ